MAPRQHDRLDWLVLLAAAGLMVWLLFVPPVLGLANNGDFHKVVGAYSLGAPSSNEYQWAPTHYTFDGAYHSDREFVSSEQLLALAAIGINRLVSPAGQFDLRCIGFLHALIYLFALWLALPLLHGFRLPARLFCIALILFVFGDVMYVSALNSFYMDTASFVFFVLTVVLGWRLLCWGRPSDAVFFLAATVLFIAGKSQHAPVGLLIAMLLAIRPAVFLPGFRLPVRVAAVLLLAAEVVMISKAAPWDYEATPMFSAVFFGVLPHTTNPVREMKVLGLDDSFAPQIGHYAYQEPSPLHNEAFVRRFLAEMSFAKLGLYLLRHPLLTGRLLVLGLNDAGHQRAYMGNYDRATGHAAYDESYAFSAWSSLKTKLFLQHGLRYLLYIAGLGFALPAVLWAGRRRLPAGAVAAGCVLVLAMFGELLIAELGDALDFVRHAFVFTATSDMVFAALAMSLVAIIRPRRGSDARSRCIPRARPAENCPSRPA